MTSLARETGCYIYTHTYVDDDNSTIITHSALAAQADVPQNGTLGRPPRHPILTLGSGTDPPPLDNEERG
jgi:hypothetical protein